MDIEISVRNEFSSSDSDIGYRRVHRSLNSQGYICRQADIRRMIKDIDPEDVNRKEAQEIAQKKVYIPSLI